MNKIILIILLAIMLTATPAQAAPTGQLSIVTATCTQSVAIWQDVPAGMVLDGGDYIEGVVNLSIHGTEYPVPMYWQWRQHIDANNRDVFQAVDWQTAALKSETIGIARGMLYVDGAPVQELDQAGVTFTMDCRHVYVPVVGR